MGKRLGEFVTFRGDRLFNGAVNISWFTNDEDRSQAAAGSFVFHGPEYHGVSQEDIGTAHGHTLQDTASFTRSLLRCCYGVEEQPFNLAIAGYGTGKSHLALTLAVLLRDPSSPQARQIVSNIRAADEPCGSDIGALLAEYKQPCLVVALNGMQSFDLTAELIRQVLHSIQKAGLNPKPIEELRPRFNQAIKLIKMSEKRVVKDLLTALALDTLEQVFDGLSQQDEQVYEGVHNFYSSLGMPIRALGGESLRDVIDVIAKEYCGEGKTFKSLVILFDEFGRYTEFATMRSQIAGSGVLQDLFEGVQANSGCACFIGFIQFELNAYVQRVAPEYKNEILRYVTRYQTANRSYLSTNLETLIAHLIEKNDTDYLKQWLDTSAGTKAAAVIVGNLGKWFPQTKNHRLWCDVSQFHTVIQKGCWPLSPYSTWLLYYLSAAGKHLQERSAIAILGEVFDRFSKFRLLEERFFSITPAQLWSDALQQELLNAEESGQRGAITHSYASVIARHGDSLSEQSIYILRAVVLASKLGLQVASRTEATRALAELAGLSESETDQGLTDLEQEFNVIGWDDAFKSFDILGDAVPKTQFLAFIRQNVVKKYSELEQTKLFASRALEYCGLREDRSSDFGEENKITTKEWAYQGVTSNLLNLPTQIQFALDRWKRALGVDSPRGTIIYCYVERNRLMEKVAAETVKMLREVAQKNQVPAVPILVVFLYDETGELGQALAELDFLTNGLTNQDRERFGHLVEAHRDKIRKLVVQKTEDLLKQRRFFSALKDDFKANLIDRVGTELFSRIYTSPLPFPFDGFSTARGNAADDCHQLTLELFSGRLDYDSVIQKPSRQKNRAVTVLKESWKAFTQSGAIAKRPGNPVVGKCISKWQDQLSEPNGQICIAEALREICLPPYGANLASAGLLLGVFIAHRAEQLNIVRKDGKFTIAQWMGDNLYRNKLFDLELLGDDAICLVGKESSEWEKFLDEWEDAESYLDRKHFFEKAGLFKKRVHVPPTLRYKVNALEEQAQKAIEKLDNMSDAQSGALEKIEAGYQKGKLALISWGAAELEKLSESMSLDQPHWTDHQIEEMRPEIERARQYIIQNFNEWLSGVRPKGATPEAVGELKAKMKQIAGNLTLLDLDELAEKTNARTVQLLKNIEAIAEATQLALDVQRWLLPLKDCKHIVKVADIRSLRDAGKVYADRLKAIPDKFLSPDIRKIREQLMTVLEKLTSNEKAAKDRLSKIFKTNLCSYKDIDHLKDELESLLSIYEHCEQDLEDLHEMLSALKVFQRDYLALSDLQLTWSEFEKMGKKLQGAAIQLLEEAEIPWSPEEIYSAFTVEISKIREQNSLDWISALEKEVKGVAQMSVEEANRIHSRLEKPPETLTDQHRKQLKTLVQKTESRLAELAIEWLIERYRALPADAKKKFLALIREA